MSWLKDKLKKLFPDATEEQIKELEDEATKNAPTPKPPETKPLEKPDPTLAMSPEVKALLDAQATTIAELKTQLTVLVDDTKTRQAATAAELKSAQEKRYDDHVKKLKTEGRVTAAEADTMMKRESPEFAKYFGALDVFLETSGKWAVDPTFKKPAPAAGDNTQTTTTEKQDNAITSEDRQKMADELKVAKA